MAFLMMLVLSSATDLTVGILDAVAVSMQKLELEDLSRELEIYYQETARLPAQQDLSSFCAGRMKLGGREPGKDRWGLPYWLETSRYGNERLNHPRHTGEYILSSAGPDRQWLTEDDVVVRKALPRLPWAPASQLEAPSAELKPGEIWPRRR